MLSRGGGAQERRINRAGGGAARLPGALGRVEYAVRLDGAVQLGVDAAPAGTVEDVGGLGGAPVGADGDDGPTGIELALVVPGLVLGDAQARQRAEDAADGGARDRAAEKRGHHPARDHRADARDEHGNGGGEDAAEHAAGDGASQGAFAVLGAFGVDDHAAADVVGAADDEADLVFAEAGLVQRVD